MDERIEAARRWLNRAVWQGHDNYGTYDLTLGVAIALGFLLLAILPQVNWLAWAAFWALFFAALWYGSVLENRQLETLGKRRARGTLLLGITWVSAVVVLLLAALLLALAHIKGWHRLPGWLDVPVFITAVLALNHLAQGVRLGIKRRLILGAAMCGVLVLLPGVEVLRRNLFLSTSILTGCLEVVGGLLGRREYMEALGRAESMGDDLSRTEVA